MTDLWPDDIGKVEPKSPVVFLREQASLLGSKTRNLLEAEIRKRHHIRTSKDFGYDFNIKSNALNYTYQLFSIQHDVELYPVVINVDEGIQIEAAVDKNGNPIANDEDEFINIIRQILGSEKTSSVINAILSQIEPAE